MVVVDKILQLHVCMSTCSIKMRAPKNENKYVFEVCGVGIPMGWLSRWEYASFGGSKFGSQHPHLAAHKGSQTHRQIFWPRACLHKCPVYSQRHRHIKRVLKTELKRFNICASSLFSVFKPSDTNLWDLEQVISYLASSFPGGTPRE